ncbi:MAG: hypothetical protein ACPLXA_12435 [Moorellaceae bacterium]
MSLPLRRALSFRQRTDVIPPHDGHPCLKLTTTATFVVRDFHP